MDLDLFKRKTKTFMKKHKGTLVKITLVGVGTIVGVNLIKRSTEKNVCEYYGIDLTKKAAMTKGPAVIKNICLSEDSLPTLRDIFGDVSMDTEINATIIVQLK